MGVPRGRKQVNNFVFNYSIDWKSNQGGNRYIRRMSRYFDIYKVDTKGEIIYNNYAEK
jgi:hypothetical protein